jgi:hypothetical protein
MRRIRPMKAKRALEELLMRRLSDEPACAGISAVIVEWRPRSGCNLLSTWRFDPRRILGSGKHIS